MAWATVGVGFVIYLVCTELFLIDAICLWCTAVHIAAFIVFVSTVRDTLRTDHPDIAVLEPERLEDASRRPTLR